MNESEKYKILSQLGYLRNKMKKTELIDFKNWLNKNHKGMYIKISDYLIEKYLKEKSNIN